MSLGVASRWISIWGPHSKKVGRAFRPSGFKIICIQRDRSDAVVAASLVADLQRGRILGVLMESGFDLPHLAHVGRVMRTAIMMNVPCVVVHYDCKAELRPALHRLTACTDIRVTNTLSAFGSKHRLPWTALCSGIESRDLDGLRIEAARFRKHHGALSLVGFDMPAVFSRSLAAALLAPIRSLYLNV